MLTRIPARYLETHTVSVRPYLGETSTGPKYGDPVDLPCMAQGKRRLVRNSDGDQVLSTLTLFTTPERADVAPAGSEVTWRGDTTTVIAGGLVDGGGLPTPDHGEVVCE